MPKNNGNFEYSIQDEIILVSGNEEVLKIPISDFTNKTIFLLNAIKENRKRTFSVPEIEEFMQSINCISLKASSETHKKYPQCDQYKKNWLKIVKSKYFENTGIKL